MTPTGASNGTNGSSSGIAFLAERREIGQLVKGLEQNCHPFPVVLVAEVAQPGLCRRLLVQGLGGQRAVVGHRRHAVDDRLRFRRERRPGEIGDVDSTSGGRRGRSHVAHGTPTLQK